MDRGICLVTGGAGFIGSALSHKLIKEFDKVVAFDNMHPQIHTSSNKPVEIADEVELMKGDVTLSEDWDKLFNYMKPDAVIHLAAETGTGQSLTEANRHAMVNVVGTTQMLDAMVRNESIPSKIILTSSRAIYGEGKWVKNDGIEFYPGQRSNSQLETRMWDFADARPLPFSFHNNRPMPTSIYGSTKLAQENLISSWSNSFDVKHTILRLQNVYGPGQSLINPYTGIVLLFARIAKEGKSIPLFEDGAMTRDFILIEDTIDALNTVLLTEGLDGKTYDIGSGYASTIAEVANIIAERYQAPPPHITGKFRNGDVRHASCDISAICNDTNWKPKWELKSGLNKLCEWIDTKLD